MSIDRGKVGVARAWVDLLGQDQFANGRFILKPFYSPVQSSSALA